MEEFNRDELLEEDTKLKNLYPTISRNDIETSDFYDYENECWSTVNAVIHVGINQEWLSGHYDPRYHIRIKDRKYYVVFKIYEYNCMDDESVFVKIYASNKLEDILDKREEYIKILNELPEHTKMRTHLYYEGFDNEEEMGPDYS